MNHPWRQLRALAGIILVMIFGMLLGAVLTWKALLPKVYDMGRHNPQEMAKFITDRLNDTFDFSPDQRAQVLQAIHDYTIKHREIHKKIEPEIEALRDECREQVRQALNDEQKKKFDVLLAAHSRKLLILSGSTMQDSANTPNK